MTLSHEIAKSVIDIQKEHGCIRNEDVYSAQEGERLIATAQQNVALGLLYIALVLARSKGL